MTTTGRAGPQLRPGDDVATRRLTTIHGEGVDVPDGDRLVHLQMRRFAGCPVCSLHLRSVVARHDEIRAANVREVVVFHSTDQWSVDELLHHARAG